MAYELIREKVAQAFILLNEYDIDCWITFVRETALNGDQFFRSCYIRSDMYSALIFSRGGSRTAIVKYDKQIVLDMGACDRVWLCRGHPRPLLSEPPACASGPQLFE
jgi:hypothetical protein